MTRSAARPFLRRSSRPLQNRKDLKPGLRHVALCAALTIGACTTVDVEFFLLKVDGQEYRVKTIETTDNYDITDDGKVWQVTVGNETAECAEPTIEACTLKVRELLKARERLGFGKPTKPVRRTSLPGLTPPYPVVEPEGE